MAITKKQVRNTEYIPREPFGTTLARWVERSRKQLRDNFKTQHIYNGTSNSAYEVYPGWYREIERRKKESPDSWIPTGQSFRETNVTIVNDNMPTAIIDFAAPMQLLFAEWGVGANGRFRSRVKRGIAVDRSKDYTHAERYIDQWNAGSKTGLAHTHRPVFKIEVNSLAKRLRWLANVRFFTDISTWLLYSYEAALIPTVTATGGKLKGQELPMLFQKMSSEDKAEMAVNNAKHYVEQMEYDWFHHKMITQLPTK